MGKLYGLENIKTIVLKGVECDECGKECKNCHFDISSHMTFSKNPDLIETLCFECWEKNYRDKKPKPHSKEKEEEKSFREYKELN